MPKLLLKDAQSYEICPKGQLGTVWGQTRAVELYLFLFTSSDGPKGRVKEAKNRERGEESERKSKRGRKEEKTEEKKRPLTLSSFDGLELLSAPSTPPSQEE